MHNAGPDPRELARRFPDLPLGRDLARLGHGTLHPVHTHRDIGPALNRILNR